MKAKEREYDFHPEKFVVREYDISSLDDNVSNHFSRMEGEQWNEFVSSIREYGVVSPLIIRPRDDGSGRYEILAGHNRKSAALEAGLTTVPCIKMDVDDVDALILLGITNQQRGKVSDLEWGWTFRTALEAVKSSRASYSRAPAADAPEREDSRTGSPRPGEKSIDVVARRFGVNRKTVQKKIRLTYLVPQLYQLGQRLHYSQRMLIDLSYLKPELQINVVQAVVIEGLTVTEAVARSLRREAAARDLSINDVLSICAKFSGELSGESSSGMRCDESCGTHCEGSYGETLSSNGQAIEAVSSKKDRASPRPSLYAIDDSLFPAGLDRSQRQEYAAAALAFIRDHNIRLDLCRI